ncbi:MAG: YfhO family protein [Pleurocapsa minor GSE-CHR-MK-17-07R]|jgi:hypothetical protein|nr:YfhO family protein [Pleurocapsa minor GSE-CHR-MK 17-07R]
MRRIPSDAWAVALLVLLWGVFFWGLLTPHVPDQVSLRQGDFSGQFYTFAGYQYARFAAGEIPLWNPYNNGGLPFVADTQAAVFYPPRLLTIALARLSGGFSYHALELEMAFHVLALTLFMYAFVRRLTASGPYSVAAATLSALVAGYCGFTAGYPPLQLALLEAGIWLPLAALGIFEATRLGRLRAGWLMLTALALGLSWLAGHPQTSYFLSLTLAAYWLSRVIENRLRWATALLGLALFAGLGAGLAAIQLVPGLEYLPQTARADLSYAEKANGFPLADVLQFVLPGVVSLFSPLYVAAVALIVGLFGLLRRAPGSLFWGLAALLALLWSFGGNGPLYPLLYSVLPGASYFRGQERAAYLVAYALAILAGLGLPSLLTMLQATTTHALRRETILAVGLGGAGTAAFVFGLVARVSPDSNPTLVPLVALIIFICIVLGRAFVRIPIHAIAATLLALTVIELFSLSRNAPYVYDQRPAETQVSASAPEIVVAALDDAGPNAGPYRVDGFRGLNDNYGSLYGVQDIHGISPLFLADARALIEAPFPPLAAWEILAVRYVFSDWGELPVASRIIASGTDRWGGISAFALEDPRPFAQVLYNAVGESDPLAAVTSGAINLRDTLVLEADASLANASSASPQPAEVISFAPERIVIRAQTDRPGWLSVALVHYPGWQADIDGQPVPLLRAYGIASAIQLPSGEHIVTLSYTPASFTLGSLLSLFSLGIIGVWLVIVMFRRRQGA